MSSIVEATRPAHYTHREWFGAWISAVFGKSEKYQHMKLRHRGYVVEYSTEERKAHNDNFQANM